MNPLISIITVCYQAEQTIEQTIQSVRSQTYPHIEFIIIDGASTDGTLTIIGQYKDQITKVISEKDNGIYDAMNKGLRMATGDYVYFLNADDMLNTPDTLTKIFSVCPAADVLYGESLFINERGESIGLRSQCTPHKVPDKLHWKSLKYGMVVSHQSFIVRREIAPNYDIRYRLCADIDWMIRCLKKARICCNTHLIIGKFRTGGTSGKRRKRSWKERYQILSKHYGSLPNFCHHLFIALRYFFLKKY